MSNDHDIERRIRAELATELAARFPDLQAQYTAAHAADTRTDEVPPGALLTPTVVDDARTLSTVVAALVDDDQVLPRADEQPDEDRLFALALCESISARLRA